MTKQRSQFGCGYLQTTQEVKRKYYHFRDICAAGVMHE